MIAALASLTTLGLVLGGLLGLAARYFRVEGSPLQQEVESLFPGAQCGQCGYPGCTPAAAAVVAGDAPVTLCPPGGRALAESLARKLGLSVDLSGVTDKTPRYAHVREALCVGCTKCFKRCPTDAIIGGPKQIHAVLMDACTGCEQCFEVCPTECIEMRPVQPTLQSWYWPMPSSAA
jgi:electron transport complex protein RnfB